MKRADRDCSQHPVMSFRVFLFLNVFAFLLIGSWLFPITRYYWDEIDLFIFTSLNAWIPVLGPGFSQVLAVVCHKRFDLIAALLIGLPCLIPGFIFPKTNTYRYWFLLFFTLGCVAILTGGNWNIFHRMSPSLVVESANGLIGVAFETKTHSHDSFPGNHGIVLMTWLSFILLFSRRNTVKLVAVLFVLLLLTPRMTVGAHWFTDNLVGGTTVALIMLSWICFTPVRILPDKLADYLLPRFQKFFITRMSGTEGFQPVSSQSEKNLKAVAGSVKNGK
jgi:Kdo2-lipid A phosphotransferase